MEFAEFIAPFDAAEFHAQHYGRRPVHIHREEDKCVSLLNWSRFNAVLAITPYWTEDTLKVYHKGRGAGRDYYCDTSDLRPGASAPVNPAKVKALLGLGASLVANQLHRVCPEVGAVANLLEREFAARVSANVYCSFKGVQAFHTHFDLHDVFAMQTEGEKTWRVYESRADAPVVQPLPLGDEVERWMTETRGRVLFEAHMKPGDILYLPRGQYHDALTGSGASLHVSFRVSPATGLALFKLLEGALTLESEFRAYLPDARRESDLQERLAKLADRIAAVVKSRAFAIDVLNHQREQARAPADYGLPAQAQTTWYSVARRARLVRRDHGFAIVFDGGEIALRATNPTVEWILAQKLFSLEGATARQAGIDQQELRRDLEQLVKAGIIVATEMR